MFFLISEVTQSQQHGKGKDSHQHCRHWSRRLWQVYHHWSLDLPMWRYRQEDHREVREGGSGGEQHQPNCVVRVKLDWIRYNESDMDLTPAI